MPLWQSIQVSPLASLLFSVCFFRALLSWFVRSIVSKAWQFRHSLESVAFIDVQTFSASSNRLASNFSRVSMVPRALCNSSLLAFIFRTNLCTHGFGSWQSDTRELLANCLKTMAANERQASLDLLCRQEGYCITWGWQNNGSGFRNQSRRVSCISSSFFLSLSVRPRNNL